MLIKSSSNSGFTLIEVLVAVVILAVGLLGLATLMMTSLQSSQSAYNRSQASLLVSDITERMRGNIKENGDSQAVNTDDYVISLSGGSTCPAAAACGGGGCGPTEQAQFDLFAWCTDLQASIPGGGASISRTGSNQYRIEVNWEESNAASGATQSLFYALERVDL